jgi:hypothetical protein
MGKKSNLVKDIVGKKTVVKKKRTIVKVAAKPVLKVAAKAAKAVKASGVKALKKKRQVGQGKTQAPSELRNRRVADMAFLQSKPGPKGVAARGATVDRKALLLKLKAAKEQLTPGLHTVLDPALKLAYETRYTQSGKNTTTAGMVKQNRQDAKAKVRAKLLGVEDADASM